MLDFEPSQMAAMLILFDQNLKWRQFDKHETLSQHRLYAWPWSQTLPRHVSGVERKWESNFVCQGGGGGMTSQHVW